MPGLHLGASAAVSTQLRTASIAPRAEPATQGLTSAGSLTGGTTKVRHIAPAALVEVRFAFGNFYNNGGTETVGPNDITVRASIEFPATTFIPLFFSGKRDVVINPGGLVWSDWVAVSIPAATQFWSRTYVTVANNTMQWPLAGSFSAALSEGSNNSATPSDQTTTGTLSGGGYGYGPFSMQGRYLASGSLRIAGVGDSRMAGNNDTDLLNGWFGRAFTGVAFTQRIAYPSEKAQTFLANATGARRKALLEGCNVAVCNYGINDLSGGRTTAQLQADVISIWSYLAARGMKTWHTTLEPETTTTDAWATLANQTIAGWNGNRTAFNDWLRDGAPVTSAANLTAVATGTVGALRAGSTGHPLSGYIELADLAESARNSGKWVVTGAANYATSDGIHPTAAIHTLMAAVPNIATLTAAAVAAG
jgi:hypothetical protein